MNIFLPEQSSENFHYLAESPETDVAGMDVMGVPIPVDGIYMYTEYSPKETFYFTRAAIVTATVTGSISAISSAIIICIILRSASKLKSPYHQIMFFMSLWDIVASTAIALSTIPMPVNVMYPFEGRSYGTKQTCRVQGLLYAFGTACGFAGNIALYAYYLATIRFKVKDETMKNRVLPVFFVLGTLVSVMFVLPYVWNDQINPGPYDSFCTISAYPHCEFAIDNVSCVAGEQPTSYFEKFFGKFVGFSIGGGLIFLVVTMIMIIVTVYRVEKARIRDLREEKDEKSQARAREFKRTKSIGIQSFCYFMAFILTWMFGVIEIIRGKTSGHPDGTTSYISALRLVFQPLQGFFSALIFVSHKVIICRRSQDMTLKEALWTIFSNTSSVPEIFISQVIMVAHDDFAETAREREIEMMLEVQRLEENSSSKRDDPSSLVEDELSLSKDMNLSSRQHSSEGGDGDGDGDGVEAHSNISPSSLNRNDLSGFDFSSLFSSLRSGSRQKEWSDNEEGIRMPTSPSHQDMNSS
mmetsp:Transcript_15732/g.22921  ORF Transcript_15732/g.22921 Transcript_15732/m.22921 type:complete len:525 (-) Transcript_15732:91-1665(-)